MQLFVKDRQFYRTALRITIPVTLQTVITIGINMADTIMLGSFGEIPLSASSLANSFYQIFTILCLGTGGGAAVITAQYWGKGDIARLKKITTIMLRIILGIAVLFMGATLVLGRQVMAVYTPHPEIIAQGADYLYYMAFTYIITGFTMTITIVLRSVGQAKLPLYCSIVAFFTNIFFNWVFIFGNLGAPRLVIKGAAIATLISRILEAAIILGYFFFIDRQIHYRIRDLFRKCGDCLGDYLRFSVPVIISDLLLALGNSGVAVVMGRIGPDFVSANAITAVVVQISTVFIQGISNASSIMTGNTLGQGETEKAYRQGVTFCCLSALVGLLAGGVILLISPLIIGYYNITPQTRAVTDQLMAAVAFIVVFQAVSSVMTKGVLRGGGDTKFLMVADILFLWVASVPLGALAGLVFHWPAFWVYTCLRIDMIIKSVWCIHRMISRKWIKVLS